MSVCVVALGFHRLVRAVLLDWARRLLRQHNLPRPNSSHRKSAGKRDPPQGVPGSVSAPGRPAFITPSLLRYDGVLAAGSRKFAVSLVAPSERCGWPVEGRPCRWSLEQGLVGEVLAQHRGLALVVRPDVRAVEPVWLREHLLICELADQLAVFKHERHVAGSHFKGSA